MRYGDAWQSFKKTGASGRLYYECKMYDITAAVIQNCSSQIFGERHVGLILYSTRLHILEVITIIMTKKCNDGKCVMTENVQYFRTILDF